MAELTHDGITQSLADWALDYGITAKAIAHRLALGWSVERAITEPMRVRRGYRLPAIQETPARKVLVSKPDKPIRASRTTPKPSRRQQAKRLDFDGHSLSIAEWANKLGIRAATIESRLFRGLPMQRVLHAGKLPCGRGVADPRRITFGGQTLTIQEWAEKLGILPSSIKRRLADGWPLERALTEPCYTQIGPGPKLITFNGETLNVKQWAERLGIPPNTIQRRYYKNLPIHLVLYPGKLPNGGAVSPNRITFKGHSLTLIEWAERLGISPGALRARLDRGWPVERALAKAGRAPKGRIPAPITFNGETLSPREWAARLGLSPHTIYTRLHARGWSLEAALTTGNVKGKPRPRGGSELPSNARDRRGESRARADLIGNFQP